MKQIKKKVVLFIAVEAVLAICMMVSSHPLRIFMLMTFVLGIGLFCIPSLYFELGTSPDKDFQWTAKTWVVLGLTSVGVITICSKSSPLYPFNDWVDANVYLTMGRAMLDGKMPYRDLYEHKGFIVYAIYALAALISRTDFLGVWIIEIAAAFFFLYYSLRSMWLFCGERAYLWIPVLAVTVYGSAAFCHGGSAEELCLPLLAYGFWVGLKAVMLKRFPTGWECFAIGLTSGCIFWIKYNLLGFYLGWFAALVLMLPKEKCFIQIWKMLWKIIAGVGIVTIPWMVWFWYHNALADLVTVYFYNNLTYAAAHESGNQLFGILQNVCRGCQEIWRNHTAAAVLIFVGMIYLLRSRYHTWTGYIMGILVFFEIGCYMGGLTYKYYALPFSVFAVIGLAALDCLICRRGNFFKNFQLFFIIELVICLLAAFLVSSNTYMLRYQKSDLPQYQFRDIIAKTPEATLLEYKTMDIGVYTVCDMVPTFRYFCYYNMQKAEIDEEQDTYLMSGEADYVVIMLRDIVSEGNVELMSKIEAAGYECVSCVDYFNGENPHMYLLYRLLQKG
ncbi:hypothetical protein FMM75_16440 [Lachnospiraceae bacterium MD335]|nr:hypothetical protein [Lachnospiraceae bacterium MD335]